MNETMTTGALLDVMRSQRQRWQSLLDRVGEDRLEEAGAGGSWSVRDVVVHVTAYERGLVEWLEAPAQGEMKVLPDLDHPDVAYRNALVLARSQGVSLPEIRAEATRTFRRLLELVEAVDERDLTAAERTEWFVTPRWGEPRPLWECIADDSYRHYQQHTPQIRRWLDSQANDTVT